MKSSRRGITLLELLVVAALLALVFLVGLPVLADLDGQLTIRSAGRVVATVFQEAHMRAIFARVNVGVRFSTGAKGDFSYAVYEDGNGNGVLADDIRRGVDKLVQGPVSLKGRFGRVTFSFLPGFAALDPSGAPVGDLADPIRFGRSDIATFSPEGSCSPGSVYLSDSRHRQEVVRIHPLMSRVQVLEYRAGTKSWERLY